MRLDVNKIWSLDSNACENGRCRLTGDQKLEIHPGHFLPSTVFKWSSIVQSVNNLESLIITSGIWIQVFERYILVVATGCFDSSWRRGPDFGQIYYQLGRRLVDIHIRCNWRTSFEQSAGAYILDIWFWVENIPFNVVCRDKFAEC